MARILAIDYGIKRTGIAVTDSLQIIATALETVETPSLKTFLSNYFKKESVEKVVIGEPTHADGNPTYIEEPIQELIVWLEKEFPTIAIARQDENLTSKLAFESLIQSGVKRKKRQDKALLDKVSATIILQHYLKMY